MKRIYGSPHWTKGSSPASFGLLVRRVIGIWGTRAWSNAFSARMSFSTAFVRLYQNFHSFVAFVAELAMKFSLKTKNLNTSGGITILNIDNLLICVLSTSSCS